MGIRGPEPHTAAVGVGWFGWLLLAMFCLSSTVGQTEGQSIGEIISNAASSSQEFAFFYDEVNDLIRVELDMVYTTEEWERLRAANASGTSHRMKRTAGMIAGVNGASRWTNRIVPYEFAQGTFSNDERQQIMAAINDWSQYTCLTFRPANSGDSNKISFRDGGGCYSRVGMVGGAQEIGLAQGCRVKSVVLHEIGHALGLQHEQTRPDRDQYVKIIEENIAPTYLFAFERYTWNVILNLGIPYDYSSIMHYGSKAFSTNNGLTIQTFDPKYQDTIGNRDSLSFRDIKTMNSIYNCKETTGGCTKSDSECPGEGFVGKDCQCWCPGDPVYTLCADSGTCKNENENCQFWAEQGECDKNPAYMHSYCKKACNKCDDGGTTTGDCVDKNEQCGYWSGIGECEKNPAYMLSYCTKSCNKCEDGGTIDRACDDENDQCEYWASIGKCEKNPNYMLTSCKFSCNQCPDCNDQQSSCRHWAERGECDVNPAYMHFYCRKSCNLCGGGGGGSTVCRDENDSCAYWASIGECSKNPDYMLDKCKQSCNICSCRDQNEKCALWAGSGECEKNPAYMLSNCKQSCNQC